VDLQDPNTLAIRNTQKVAQHDTQIVEIRDTQNVETLKQTVAIRDIQTVALRSSKSSALRDTQTVVPNTTYKNTDTVCKELIAVKPEIPVARKDITITIHKHTEDVQTSIQNVQQDTKNDPMITPTVNSDKNTELRNSAEVYQNEISNLMKTYQVPKTAYRVVTEHFPELDMNMPKRKTENYPPLRSYKPYPEMIDDEKFRSFIEYIISIYDPDLSSTNEIVNIIAPKDLTDILTGIIEQYQYDPETDLYKWLCHYINAMCGVLRDDFFNKIRRYCVYFTQNLKACDVQNKSTKKTGILRL